MRENGYDSCDTIILELMFSATLFLGSLFFPFPGAPGEGKKRDPGNLDDVQCSIECIDFQSEAQHLKLLSSNQIAEISE